MKPITLPILAEASWTLLLGTGAAAVVLLMALFFAWFIWRLVRDLSEEAAREEAARDEKISGWINAPSESATGPGDRIQRVEDAIRNEETIRRSGGY